MPLVTPLANVIMSGVTPKVCAANARAGAPEAGDHLVEDQQQAVLVADRAQPLQVALRRHQHAGGAGHRLDDHRGDVGRVVQRDDARLQLVGEMRAPRGLAAAEGVVLEVVGVGQVIDARQHAAERLAVGRNAADRDAAEADAVIAALAADQHVAVPFAARAVVGEGDLQRGIDRLGARVGEEHVVEAVRRKLRDQRGGAERARVPHLEQRANSRALPA